MFIWYSFQVLSIFRISLQVLLQLSLFGDFAYELLVLCELQHHHVGDRHGLHVGVDLDLDFVGYFLEVHLFDSFHFETLN